MIYFTIIEEIQKLAQKILEHTVHNVIIRFKEFRQINIQPKYYSYIVIANHSFICRMFIKLFHFSHSEWSVFIWKGGAPVKNRFNVWQLAYFLVRIFFYLLILNPMSVNLGHG